MIKKFTTSALLILILALPFDASAQVPGLDQLSNISSVIKTGSQILDKIPTVPTNDLKQNAKETGISVFGVNIGVSWNQLALNIARIVVNQVVDSTVNWMKSGFDGNPAYVTDPGTYFGNIANGVVGDELNRISKGALCSPFQAKVTLSLRGAYAGAPYSSQCTLTGVVKNFDQFMDKFSEGDWNQWYAVTQNAANNPYGAFANAQITINNKVEAQVNSVEKELTWGSGFKSQKVCKKRNMSADEMWKWYDAHPDVMTYPPGYDSKAGPGGCIEYGDVQTPGATIKTHLDKALPGTKYIEQITTADQFDKLLTALGQGLLQRFVFKEGGLLGKSSSKSGGGGSGSGGGGSVPETKVTCMASTERGTIETDEVIWTVSSNFDGTTVADYTWADPYAAGEGSVSGQKGLSAKVTYNTPGIKTASVIASTTKLNDLGQPVGASQTQTFTCSSNVKISKYHPLQISCVADAPRIVMPIGTNISSPVTWKAVVSGGSGTFQYIKWDGDQQVPPKLSGKSNTIFPYELTQEQSNLPRLNWCYSQGRPHTGPVCDSYAASGAKSGATIQSLSRDPASVSTNPVFNLGLSRVYFKPDGSNLGTVKANVTVWDVDPLLEPIQNFECPAVPVLDY